MWPQAGEQSLKRHTFRTSLVQWLRHTRSPQPHTHGAACPVSIPGQGTKITQWGPKKEAYLYPQGQTRHKLVYPLPRKHTSPVMLHATSQDLQLVKNRLRIQEKDSGLIPGSGRSPEEGMATHSSVLAWKMPWRKEPGRLRFIEGCSIELSVFHCRESNMTEVT